MMYQRQELYRNFLAQGGGQTLSSREEEIITMIAGGKGFEEIGIHFAVTRERIRQLADKASRKIKRIADQQEAKRLRNERIPEAKTKGLGGLAIEDLDLSVRTYNCLRNAGITHVGQFSEITTGELLHIKNFGRKSFNEIKELTGLFGIRFKDEDHSTSKLSTVQQNDLDTIIAGIKKLPEDEAREVSLCLLNLLLPLVVNNQEGISLLRHMRDGLLGG